MGRTQDVRHGNPGRTLSGLMEKCAAVPAVDFGYLLRLSGLLVAAGRMLPDSAVALLQSVQYANEEKEETDHADA